MRLDERPITSAERMTLGHGVNAPLAKKDEEPSWLSTADAVMRRENEIWSYIENENYQSSAEAQEGYDQYADLPEKYHLAADRFRDVKSPEERDMRISQIDSEWQRADVIARSGPSKYAWGVLAALGNPSLLPFIMVNPLRGVGSVAAGAARLGALGAAETALSETALQATQQTRSWKESFGNVAAATLLTSGAGAAIAKLTLKQQGKILGEIQGDVDDIVKNDSTLSVGAAEALTLEDEAMVHRPWISGKYGKYFTVLHGMARSDVAESHAALNKYWGHSMTIGKNRKRVEIKNPDGTTTVDEQFNPKEHALSWRVSREENEYLHKLKDSIQTGYKEWAGVQTMIGGRMKRGGRRLPEFNSQVAKAMRNNDLHSDTIVQNTAKKLRADILEPIRKLGVDMEKFSDEDIVKFALSYFPKRYNRVAIMANPKRFQSILLTDFKNQFRKNFEDQVNALRGEGDTAAADKLIASGKGDLTDEVAGDLELAARDTTNRILNGEEGEGAYYGPSQGSAFKERKLPVEDNVLDEGGFLINDVEDILGAHVRGTLRPLRMLETAGDTEMEDVLSGIRSAYENKVVKLRNAGKEKEATALDAEGREVRDMHRIARDRYYNRTPNIATNPTMRSMGVLGRVLRRFNMTNQLGGVTATSLGDPARINIRAALKFGFSGVKPSVWKSLKRMKGRAEGFRNAGIAAEKATKARATMLSDANEAGSYTSKVDEWTRRRSNEFMTVTGLSDWTDFMKLWSASAAQDNMMSELINYSTLKSRRKMFLAEEGFNEDYAKRIVSQYKKYGDQEDGGHNLNWDDWDDKEMAEKVKTAIFVESERTLVSPSEVDKPFFMDNEVAKIIFQYKSFSFAAHNQVTQRSFSRMRLGDAQQYALVVNTTLAGMAVDVLKLYASGREDELKNYKAADFILAGLDRGGAVPMVLQAFNTADLFTGNAITGAMGAMPAQRFSDRARISALLGPSVGQISNMSELASIFADGEVDERDVRLLKRLMPYNNLVWTNRMANWAVEQAARDMKKVPGRKGVKF